MASQEQKWKISALSAFIFTVLSLPETYALVHSIVHPLLGITVVDDKKCPTYAGVLLHALVFLVITKMLMDVDIPGISVKK